MNEMNKFEKILNDISGLENALMNEGVSKEEVMDVRKLYLGGHKSCAYETLEVYKKYMITKYDTMKKYWDNRWSK